MHRRATENTGGGPAQRPLGVLCALCAAAAGLLACAQRELPPAVAADGKIHLVYWQSYNSEEQAVFDRLAAQFEREYAAAHPDRPPVVIDGREDHRGFPVPYENMDQQLASAAQAGATPDLVRLDYHKILGVAYGQVAVPLETLAGFAAEFPGETIDTLRGRFVGGAYDACVLWRRGERHLYALPEQLTCLALYWNRALFRARRAAIAQAAAETGLPLSHEHPPRTWEELAALGRALTWVDEGRPRFGYGMRDSLWFTLPFLFTHGVEIVEQDPATGRLFTRLASDPAAALALAALRDYTRGGPQAPAFEGGAWRSGSDRTDRGFEIGTYAMVLEGSWTLQRCRDAGLDFGVALVPRLSSAEAERFGVSPGENRTATNLGGNALVIVRTAQERGVADAALAFAAWLTSPAVQAEWGRALGQIPVNLEAQRLIEGEVDDRARAFLVQSRSARALPAVPHYNVLETEIFNPNMVRVFQGTLTPEEALARIQRDTEARILSLL